MKRKPPRARPNRKLSAKQNDVQMLASRLNGMEIRLGAMNTRMESLGREEAAVHTLSDLVARLEGTMYVMFESVCNLDDLLRPNAVESLRAKRIEFFRKA